MNGDKPNETRADGALNESAEHAAQEAARLKERRSGSVCSRKRKRRKSGRNSASGAAPVCRL